MWKNRQEKELNMASRLGSQLDWSGIAGPLAWLPVALCSETGEQCSACQDAAVYVVAFPNHEGGTDARFA